MHTNKILSLVATLAATLALTGCLEALDKKGDNQQSGNKAPFTEMLNPTNGATLSAGNIELRASASDEDGTISKVEFYRRGDVGQDVWIGFGDHIPNTDQWKLPWPDLGAGSFTVHSVATDNDGAVWGSDPITFTVSRPNQVPTMHVVVPNGAGTAFEANSLSGRFGIMREGDPFEGDVYFTLGGTANALGQDYVLSPNVACEGVSCKVHLLNSDLVAWIGLWPIDDQFVEGDETATLTLQVRPTYSVGVPDNGTILIKDNDVAHSQPNFTVTANPDTVTVGQCTTIHLDVISDVTSCVATGGASNDNWAGVIAVTDMDRMVCPTLWGTTTSYGWRCTGPGGSVNHWADVVVLQPQNNQRPTVTVQAPANVVVGTTIQVTASASDPDGSVSSVEFFVTPPGGVRTSLGFDATAPYSWSWTAPATVGSYSFTAVATDNLGLASLPAPPANTFVYQSSNEVPCHGLRLYFTSAQVNDITSCSKWSKTGQGSSINKSTLIEGGDGACAITCYSSSGQTVLPSAVSGVWLQNGSSEVDRWYTSGCARLPDHPANEPDQAGGTWDRRCDRAVQTLTGPPTP